MYNGLFPNDPFGFLLEFPQIILSLGEINKLITSEYKQIQFNNIGAMEGIKTKIIMQEIAALLNS